MKNSYSVSRKQWFWILFLILASALLFITIYKYELKHIERLNAEYEDIQHGDSLSGFIIKKEVRKGPAYLTLSKGNKVALNTSHNYLYDSYFMDEFLQVGDSLVKQEGSDTLFVYRNTKKYYFVLGEFINKDMW